jgi:hypothetical protein
MDNKDLVIIGLSTIIVGLVLDDKWRVRKKNDNDEAQAVVDTIFKNIIRNSQK